MRDNVSANSVVKRAREMVSMALNGADPQLPFAYRRPPEEPASVLEGVSMMALQYLLGPQWDMVSGVGIDKHSVRLRLEDATMTFPALAVKLLEKKTGTEWHHVRTSEIFGSRPRWMFETRVQDALFPNLPGWLWGVFFDVQKMSVLRQITFDEENLVIECDGASISAVTPLLSHVWGIPRSRILCVDIQPIRFQIKTGDMFRAYTRGGFLSDIS